jgi:uncharacterized protein YceH (UPF0502 family)
MKREDGPVIARLPRAPAERESRYAHLFFGAIESAPESEEPMEAPAEASGAGALSLARRVEQLEETVAEMRREIDALKSLAHG